MNQKSSTLASGERISPTYQGPTETTFCSTTNTFSDPITITGTAQYIRREVWGDPSSGGLGSASTSGLHPATAKPIRQAEVRVTDASGAVVQCSTTNDSGAVSLTLPRGSATYTVSINSRANNTLLYASVLNQPEKNQFYSLTTTVIATGATNFGTLTAGADGDVLGAAFNILDQIYNSNIYLRAQVSTCSTGFVGCKNVTASMTTLSASNSSGRIPKVTAYWTKGYNPNNYFGGTGGLSFYLPDYSRLFILGGQNGDVNSSDTDHFDDSVIIHEYGHFLEDVLGISDSPGGQHTGTKPIDPRLAWSEGWGNFFQAAVRNQARYIDTVGNDDGITDMAFYVDLESVSSPAGYDYPTQSGEGNFREFSVTRMLWDVVDSNADNAFGSANETISNAFDEIWAAFTSTTRGFPLSIYSFRNVGLLHLIQRKYNVRDWVDVRAANRHDGDTSEYSQYVTTSCGTAPYPGGYYYSITPASYSGDDGSFSKSDLLNNNDFFHFKAPASGSATITLQYKDADGVAQQADLDLYVYKQDYTFGASSSWVGMSRKNPTGAANTETEAAAVKLTKDANYLLNVFVYTGNGIGTTAYYNLLYNGSPLCPATIVP